MCTSRKKLGSFPFRESEIQGIFLKASKNEHCIYLDSHQHQDSYGKYEAILAWGAMEQFYLEKGTDLNALYRWQSQLGDWVFGHLSYELKSILENIKSPHEDPLEWKLASFFQPANLLIKKRGQKEWTFESIHYQNTEELRNGLKGPTSLHYQQSDYRPLIPKEQYLEDVTKLLAEIQYGNIYEINYCQCFEARGAQNPPALFLAKNLEHQAPFSAFYRQGSQYALSFSPERYLRKEGSKITSQPIKGTAPRGEDPLADKKAQASLLASEKERAENVMIVDLVRNDLSRTARKNSVHVSELFGIYSFNAVHQMISTVESDLDEEKYHWGQLLASSFPMGSMTGAPKYNAMKLADRFEHFNRGLYSGSIGYIDPQGNFDFNVVIRSILYHAEKKLARIAVGGAITTHCEAEAEYEECMLKAEKLFS